MGAGIQGVVDATGNALDKIITSPEERLEARKAITEILLTKLNELASYQRDVLQVELQGSKLQRNWRPVVMLSFAFIILYHYFLQPFIGFCLKVPVVELPPQFWNLLEIGMGGYVIGRSVEKVAGTVSQSLPDMTKTRRERKTEKE